MVRLVRPVLSGCLSLGFRSNMLVMGNKLITDYKVELAEPGCTPGSGRWGGRVRLRADISPVFPYLNASLTSCRYDHANQVLIWRDDHQTYAFRPLEIRVASVSDWADAERAMGEAVALVNRVWQQRDQITPDFTEKVLPGLMTIFKLLPRTNCRECGYPTCLAFAAALRAGSARLEQCAPLLDESFTAKREELRALLPQTKSKALP